MTMKEMAVELRDALRAHPALGPLLLVNLLASLTTGLMLPVLPLFLAARGLSFIELGLAFSIVALASVGVQILAGRQPAFFARKDVICGLLLVSMLAFPGYLFVTSTVGIVAVAAVSSFSGAAAGPGLSMFLAASAPQGLRATFFSYLGSASSFAYALAIVAGGFLVAVGYEWVFYVATLGSLLSFVFVAALLLRARDGPAAWTRVKDPALRAVARDLGRHEARLARDAARLDRLAYTPPRAMANARWAAGHAFLFSASLAAFPVYLPIFLQQNGLAIQWVGLVVAASWITFGVCQPLGARYADRTGRHRPIILVSLVIAAILCVAMGISSLPWIIAAWVLLGIADGIGRPLTSALIVDCCQGAARANAFGLMAASDTAARIVAPFALAFLIQGFGLPAVFLAAGAIVFASVGPLLFVRPERAPAPQAPPVPAGDAA